MKRYLYFLLIPLFLSSCIRSETEIGKRFEALFYVPDIGTEYVYGTDTVVVNEFKFAIGGLSLVNEDSVELTNNTRLLYTYISPNDRDNIILSAPLGFEINNFTNYEFNVGPVVSTDRIFDDEFFGQSSNYSLVIEGEHNGNRFLYQSAPVFTKNFSFEPVTLSDNQETVFIRTQINMRDLFLNANGDFVRPGADTSFVVVNPNVEEGLSVSAFAGSVYNF